MTRKIILGGLIGFGLALLMSSQASAGGGSWGSDWYGGSHGSQGSWASYGSHGSYGSYGSYRTVVYASAGSHGSYGSRGGGGLFSRIRAHRARKWASNGGSWGGSSGGSYGSWGGSSGGSYGSWGGSPYFSHGSVGSYASYCAPVYTETVPATPVYEGEVITEKPVLPPPAEVESAAEGLDGPSLDDSTLNDATRGLLLVSLPKSAKLFVNGHPTSSTGDTRRFVATGLQPGYRYPYAVKAVIERDGTTIDQTKEVKLRAGRSVRLAFDFDEPAETMITVNVPADAELTLAGSKTISKGARRKFTTKQLAEGQIWSGYTIVASLERNGQTLTKEQTIDLRGGESRQLTFDFELNQVASR